MARRKSKDRTPTPERENEARRLFDILAKDRAWWKSSDVAKLLTEETGRKHTAQQAKRLLERATKLGFLEQAPDSTPPRWGLARGPSMVSPLGVLSVGAERSDHQFELPAPNTAVHAYFRPSLRTREDRVLRDLADQIGFGRELHVRIGERPPESIVDDFLSIPREFLIANLRSGPPTLLVLHVGDWDLEAYFQHRLEVGLGQVPPRILVQKCIREAVRRSLQRKGAWDDARDWGEDEDGNPIVREAPEDEPWPMLNDQEEYALEDLDRLTLPQIARRHRHTPVYFEIASEVTDTAVSGNL